jgi:hypothetical protein
MILTASLRVSAALTNTIPGIQFNGDTGAVYDSQRTVWNNAAPGGGTPLAGGTSGQIPDVSGANATANKFSPMTIYITDYLSANHKSYHAQGHLMTAETAAGTFITGAAGTWRSTAPISSLVLLPLAGTSFVTGCRAILHGIV